MIYKFFSMHIAYFIQSIAFVLGDFNILSHNTVHQTLGCSVIEKLCWYLAQSNYFTERQIVGRFLHFDRLSLNCDQSLKMLSLFYLKNGFPPSGTMKSFDVCKDCV